MTKSSFNAGEISITIVLSVFVILIYIECIKYHPKDKLKYLLMSIGTIILWVIGVLIINEIFKTGELRYSTFAGREYGLFSRKKKQETLPQTNRTFTNYGNPMKQQTYVAAGGIKTEAKTDSSKIYRSFGK